MKYDNEHIIKHVENYINRSNVLIKYFLPYEKIKNFKWKYNEDREILIMEEFV